MSLALISIICYHSHSYPIYRLGVTVITVFHCVLTAKLQEGGNPVDVKNQSDKNPDACKKPDVNTYCQCVCHSKAIKPVSATVEVKPAVVDLTVSPLKDQSIALQLPPTPAHCKSLSVPLLSVVPFGHVHPKYIFLNMSSLWISTVEKNSKQWG